MSDQPDFLSDLYRGPAPSSVSDTSAVAASKVSDPMRAKSYRKIIEALAAGGAMTREQIIAATGMKESSACARIWELRPQWIRAIEAAGKSAAGMSVDKYELTDAGLNRWRQAGAMA